MDHRIVVGADHSDMAGPPAAGPPARVCAGCREPAPKVVDAASPSGVCSDHGRDARPDSPLAIAGRR